MLVINP